MFIADQAADSIQTLPPTGTTMKPRSKIFLHKWCLSIFPTNLPALALWNLALPVSKHSKPAGLHILELCDLSFLCEPHPILLSVMEERDHCPMHEWSAFLGLHHFCTIETPFGVNNLYNPGTTSSIFLADIYEFKYGYWYNSPARWSIGVTWIRIFEHQAKAWFLWLRLNHKAIFGK